MPYPTIKTMPLRAAANEGIRPNDPDTGPVSDGDRMPMASGAILPDGTRSAQNLSGSGSNAHMSPPAHDSGVGAARWPAPAEPDVATPPARSIPIKGIDLCKERCATLVAQIPSTAMAVRSAITDLCQRLAEAGLDPTDGMTFEIVLAEATNNIVEHAYRNDESGWILLEIDFVDGWVMCRLTDGGFPLPDGSLPARKAPSEVTGDMLDISTLPEGGFGWSMIHELTSYLIYDRQADTNILRFALSVSRVASA